MQFATKRNGNWSVHLPSYAFLSVERITRKITQKNSREISTGKSVLRQRSRTLQP